MPIARYLASDTTVIVLANMAAIDGRQPPEDLARAIASRWIHVTVPPSQGRRSDTLRTSARRDRAPGRACAPGPCADAAACRRKLVEENLYDVWYPNLVPSVTTLKLSAGRNAAMEDLRVEVPCRDVDGEIAARSGSRGHRTSPIFGGCCSQDDAHATGRCCDRCGAVRASRESDGRCGAQGLAHEEPR